MTCCLARKQWNWGCMLAVWRSALLTTSLNKCLPQDLDLDLSHRNNLLSWLYLFIFHLRQEIPANKCLIYLELCLKDIQALENVLLPSGQSSVELQSFLYSVLSFVFYEDIENILCFLWFTAESFKISLLPFSSFPCLQAPTLGSLLSPQYSPNSSFFTICLMD